MFILEIIGTIAFAVSGAFVGIKTSLDIFGVIFVGCITAFGGGILRDILVGVTPPTVFYNPHILFIAVITSAVVFIVAYINRQRFDEFREQITHINNVFDAVGLAAFSVMGTEVALAKGFGSSAFVSIVLGMLTGVGGGIFRDILVDTTPYVFKKHIYALASIFGSFVYYILRRTIMSTLISSVVAMVLVVAVRMLATKYLWSLPKIKFENNDNLPD